MTPRRACALLSLVCLLIVALPASGAAQTPPVVNPSGFEFTPSPDHDAIGNTVPLVTKYTLDIAAAGATSTVLKTLDLGKPTVTAGKITCDATHPCGSTTLAAIRDALPAGSYVASVKAEGWGGVSPAAFSDPFTVAARAPGAPGKVVWK